MQLDPELLGRAERALTRFRLGGVAIAAIPLIFSFVHAIGPGHGQEGLIFGIMSICLVLMVVWITSCGERFLRALRSAT